MRKQLRRIPYKCIFLFKEREMLSAVIQFRAQNTNCSQKCTTQTFYFLVNIKTFYGTLLFMAFVAANRKLLDFQYVARCVRTYTILHQYSDKVLRFRALLLFCPHTKILMIRCIIHVMFLFISYVCSKLLLFHGCRKQHTHYIAKV